jgi:hypothetical protein
MATDNNSILIGQLRKNVKLKPSRPSSVFGGFNVDGKYGLRLLNGVMSFKRKRKYCKFHFVNVNQTDYFQRPRCRSHRNGRRHDLYLAQVMQTTIVFSIYKAFYFKNISMFMKRICELQIMLISSRREFLFVFFFSLCIASSRICSKRMTRYGIEEQIMPFYDAIGHR